MKGQLFSFDLILSISILLLLFGITVSVFSRSDAVMKEFAFELSKTFYSKKIQSYQDSMKESIYKGEPKYFKDGAETIKKQFDERFKGSWHVIIG